MKQIRRRIMLRAWYFYKSGLFSNFSQALKSSWNMEKSYRINPKLYRIVSDIFEADELEQINRFAAQTGSSVKLVNEKVLFNSMMNSYTLVKSGYNIYGYCNSKPDIRLDFSTLMNSIDLLSHNLESEKSKSSYLLNSFCKYNNLQLVWN